MNGLFQVKMKSTPVPKTACMILDFTMNSSVEFCYGIGIPYMQIIIPGSVLMKLSDFGLAPVCQLK